MGVIEKAPEIRFFTWYITFPDGETKWKQDPFLHDLMFELKNIGFKLKAIGIVDHPSFERELLTKGEYKWTDYRKNKWLLRIEKTPKRDNWV